MRILRRHIEVLGFGSNFTIYDADDQKTVMKEIFRKFDINTKIYKERGVLADISHAKDELITPEEMELNAGGDPDARKIAGMYKEYQSILRGNNALDFDDLIVKTVELFSVIIRISWTIIRNVSNILWWMSIRIPILPSLNL